MQLQYKHAADAIHFDNEKRVAYFKPYDPNDIYPPIIQNNQEMIGYHHVSKNAIEDVAHEFNKDIRIIGIDHEDIAKSSLVENFIVRGNYKFPKSNYVVSDGSWIVGIKMESDELWDAAKDGKIKGISPAGHYIDRYYDDKSGKWVVNKLNCKELSLVINKVPDNKTPMLYMHANKGEENMEDQNKVAEGTPAKEEPKTQSDTQPVSMPFNQPAPGQSNKNDEALNQTLSGLSKNIKQNTETLKQLDPNYDKKQAISERQDLVKTLQESRDPAAKSLLAQLQQQPDQGDDEKQIVGVGFDTSNLQTEEAAKEQGVGFQDTNIQTPQIQTIKQKQSPDVFIDPDKHLKEQRQKGQPKTEISKEVADKAHAITKKYADNRTLNPWDKHEELADLASQL